MAKENPFADIGGVKEENPFADIGGKKEAAAPVPAASTAGTPGERIVPPPTVEDTRPFDAAAVKKIKDIAASVGQVVSDEEATRRARNLYSLSKESGTLRASPAPGAGAKLGTAVEGFISGFVPFGELIVGGAEEALTGGEAPVGSSLGFEAMRGRREESPYTAGASEFAGIAASLGLEALPRLAIGAADKVSTRLAKFLLSPSAPAFTGKAGEKTAEVAGKVTGAFSKLARTPVINPLQRGALKNEARLVGEGESLATRTMDALDDLVEMSERKRVGQVLTRAEKDIVGGRVGEQLVIKTDRQGKVIRQRGVPVLERVGGKEVKGGAEVLSKAGFSDEQIARALAERRVSEDMVQALDKAGSLKVFSRDLPRTLYETGKVYLPQTVAATVGTAGYAAQRALTNRLAMTDEELAATGESTGAAVVNAAVKSVPWSVGLSLGSPLAVAGVSKGLQAVGGLWESLAKGITSNLGTKFTFLDKPTIGAAFDAATKVTREDLMGKRTQFLNSLQGQHDYVYEYTNHLETLARDIASRSTTQTPADVRSILFEGADIPLFLKRVQDKYMKQMPDGTYQLLKTKVIDDMDALPLKEVLVPVAGGATERRFIVDMPDEIRELQTAVGRLEYNLRQFATDTQMELELMGSTLPAELRSGLVAEGPVAFPGLFSRPSFSVKSAEGAELERNMYDTASRLLQGNTYPGNLLDRPFFGRRPVDVFPEMGITVPTGKGRGARYERATKLFGLETEARNKLAEVESRTFGNVALPLGVAVATEIGVSKLFDSLVGGLPLAAATGLMTRYVMDSLTNPAAAVRSYKALQTAVSLATDSTKEFSRTLLGNVRPVGGKVGEFVGTSTVVQKPEKPNVQFTRRDAEVAFTQDREFFLRFADASGVENVADFFAGNESFDQLSDVFPNMTEKSVGMLPRQAAFLSKKISDAVPPTHRADPDYKPTAAALHKYGIYSQYTLEPDSIYADINDKKYVPDAAMEVLREVYPARLAYLRSQIFDSLVDMKVNKQKLSRAQETIVNKIMTDDPRRPFQLSLADVNKLQATFARVQQPPAREGGPTNARVRLETEGTTRER